MLSEAVGGGSEHLQKSRVARQPGRARSVATARHGAGPAAATSMHALPQRLLPHLRGVRGVSSPRLAGGGN